MMKCSGCKRDSFSIWITKDYDRFCYDCITQYREGGNMENEIEEKEYDEIEYACDCENCNCVDYDVCDWCAEEDCTGCGEWDIEFEDEV